MSARTYTPGRRAGTSHTPAVFAAAADTRYSTSEFLYGISDHDLDEARFYEDLEDRDRYEERR